MKQKLFTICSAAYIIFAAASCNNFLELTPISNASEANFYKNETDIETAINGAYASLQSDQMYREYFVTMMEVRSDNVTDNNPGAAGGIFYNIDNFTADADNSIIREAWAKLYNQVYTINKILDNTNVVANESKKMQFEAEARFLRALAYFNIVRLWGAAPLVLSPITTDESYSKTRNSTAEIYQAIENDLQYAANLPKTYASGEYGRATSGAAKTLLAKVYLTQKKYQQALSELQNLVSQDYTSVYQLEENIEDVFKTSNKGNKELIFAIRFSKTVSGESARVHDAFTTKFGLSNSLLNGYETSDTRKDLLSYANIDGTFTVKKYADTKDEITGGFGFDVPVMRYSDVLLMYAETQNELNNATEALIALNKVRLRAKAMAYSAETLNNQQLLRNAILQERRLEFPLENQRWFDLIRTEQAIAAMAANNQTISADDFLYPIPESEVLIMNNKETFPQNTGY